MRDTDTIARLARRALRVGDCLLWFGARNGEGYGTMRVGSRQDHTRRTALVHRLAYELFVGEIAPGMEIGRTCRRENCIEPAHLFQAYHVELISRGETGTVNRAKDMCPNGHAYDEENTRVTKAGRRQCRACDREAKRARRERAA